jgi:hypothetical protein
MAFTGGGGTVAAQSVTVAPAIAGLPGANVYDALGSAFPKAGGTFTGGISFGANIGANTGDASKHITLYDGFAGFSITPNRMNAFAGAALGSGAAFFVTINGLDRLAVAEDLVSITAPLVLPADPTAPLQAATKQYVDSKSGGASLTVADTPPTIANGKMWFDSNKTQLYVGYDDGTSSQWVIANNPNVVTTGAINTALQPTYNNVGRNLIHNSMFNIWQRGTSFTQLNGRTADRWSLAIAGADTVGVALAPLSDTNRTNIGDEAAKYCMNVNVVGSTGHTYIQQSIEDMRRLAGKTVTVSFWSNANKTLKLGVNILQSFGSGGSPSAGLWVQATGNSITVGTTFARYSMTFAIPSIIGKTVGTNGDDYHGLAFWYSAGDATAPLGGNIGIQSGIINIWGVQLEIGNVATPLEKLDPRIDLANCQRFYQKGFFDQCAYMVAVNSISSGFPFSVQMRVSPTVTTSNVVLTNATELSVSAWNNSFLSFGCVATTSNLTRCYGEFQASADL